MYLKRKLDDFLLKWKESTDKKPLIVKGARQIGKTESILHFSANYENFVNINFALDRKYANICEDGYGVAEIVRNISRISPGTKFSPGKTLILFDEIQDCPEIATALKSFCLDGRFDVVCSGSMLGVNYKRIESNSVGHKSEFAMQSLDFEEFLWAMGYGETDVEDMLAHMRSTKPFNKTTMATFDGLFLDYCVLGGMPAVVRSFVERRSFENTLAIQRELLADYGEDVRKYAEGLDQARILNVFRSVPVQLAKENKKFQISKVARGARFRDYRGCVEWLEDAGIVNVCHALHTPELPLKGNFEEEKCKLYFRDTGLLVASLDDEAQEDLRANRNMGVYKGGLYENVVAEALSKQGYGLFYYKKENSTLEQDFFVRTKKSLVPVEVKASNGTAKSLATLVRSGAYPDIAAGIKLVRGNVGFQNGIYTFPYFCAFLLKRYLETVDY